MTTFSHRHTKHAEEYRGLLSNGGGNASVSSLIPTTIDIDHSKNVARRPNAKMRFSAPILVCSVFLLGALCGSYLSSSSSGKNDMIASIFPSSFKVKEYDGTTKARYAHVSSMCRCPSDKVRKKKDISGRITIIE